MANKRNTEFKSIKSLMHNVLQENKLQKGIDLITIKEAWATVMGSGVASYTKEVHSKMEH